MLERLIVLVEEPSMEVALKLLLPRMLGDTDFEIHPFRCKADLLDKLPSRLRGYKSWLRFQVVNRVVVEELEAWFFGDWDAVRTAYPRMPEAIPRQARYRDPDAITGGTWEAIERIFKRAGYFKGGLRKLELAHEIATHMDPARNTSGSFQAFRNAVATTLAGFE